MRIQLDEARSSIFIAKYCELFGQFDVYIRQFPNLWNRESNRSLSKQDFARTRFRISLVILPLSLAMFLTHLAARINLSPIRRVFSDQSRRLNGTDGSRCREWSRPILPNTAITNARLSRRDISQYDGLACREAKGTPMFARLSNSCTAAIFPCDTRRYFYATASLSVRAKGHNLSQRYLFVQQRWIYLLAHWSVRARSLRPCAKKRPLLCIKYAWYWFMGLRRMVLFVI